MKKVFQSNAQLCHAWANQLQSEGRGSNMFFKDGVIYSYGHHYKIAKFFETPAGEKVIFVNANGYSNSTAKHTRHVVNAIPQNIRYFKVPFPKNFGYYYNGIQELRLSDLPAIIERLTLNAKNNFFEQLKAKSNFSYYSKGIHEYNSAFVIATLFNLSLPVMPENEREAYEKSEQLRATVNEREGKKAQRELEKNMELLHKWLNYEYNGQIYNIPVHLRVSKDGELIETTKGAKVSFDAAKRLLNKLLKNDDIKGENIDGFTVIENNDNHIKIGCHTIAWPVINNFFNI